jgi:asparagine synthase (glutamine-hydrolysing)
VSLNGENYNYIEVRDELRRLGHVFRSATDTEVLVEAYREWGDRCFERLNGMWAIALYDVMKRELILCRDRTGERPLYWVRRNDAIIFASEIKALLNDQVYPDRKVNDMVVHNFLYQAVSDLDEHTFFDGIDSVPIATVVRINHEGQITRQRFWQVPDERVGIVDEGKIPAVCEQLRELLKDSVRLRLRADVPVNVALSGGMDSSSIVAMAATVRGAGVGTYSVRFREKEWNEWRYADAVAKRYAAKKFVVDPEHDWIWQYLGSFVKAMEEPFHAPDLVSDHVVRRMLAARGVRVSLSGIGGDEIFAGYDYYRRFHALDLKRSGNVWSALKVLVFASDTSPARRIVQLARHKTLRFCQRWQIVTDRTKDLRAEAFVPERKSTLRLLPESCAERLVADVRWALLPYWLRAGDKSSMTIPIEIRYPFLDYRLIEFGMGLPISLLIRGGWTKWVLREAMKDMLPREVIWRKVKMGFPFPIVEWLTDGIPRLEAIFSEMDNPYLSTPFWSARVLEAIKFDPWLVWRAFTFELWHRYYLRGLEALPECVADTETARTEALLFGS